MRIALVKQEVYQDLYVCDNSLSKEELLFSSQGRVGPYGLFSLFDADFYIIKEEYSKECQMWTRIIPGTKDKFRRLKIETLEKLPGQEFKEPGSTIPNGFYAINAYEVDWSKYDVVISINFSIPTNIIKQYKSTLWAYMIGEANFMMDKVYFGYDVSLNQEIKGLISDSGIIDFPYTFIGPYCLENTIKNYLKKESENRGIYVEVNSVKERPVKRVPQLDPITAATGQPARLHKQLIRDNLIELYNSKYYLKLGGRKTRGNGAIEAISLGTLVLMSPRNIVCSQILPKETWVFNEDDAIKMIKYLDQHTEEYERLLKKQRELVQQFVIDYPFYSLKVNYEKKMNHSSPNEIIEYNLLHYAFDIAKKLYRKYRRISLKR